MISDIKISIIVPMYNVEKYLLKCLDSLVNQTLKDIEIICINDGSTDNSLEILNNYAQNDSRIKVINKENGGVSSARNSGLDIAEGKYVMFVDSDDWLELNACELAYNEITRFDSDLLVFDIYNANVDGTKQISHWLRTFLKNEIFYFNSCPEKFFYSQTSIWGKLFKKSLLFNKFNANLKKGEDTAYFWQTCLYNPKISVLNLPLYNYLANPQSAMFSTINVENCEIFNSLNYLKSLRIFHNTSSYNKAHILDRFALSVEYEMRHFKNCISKEYCDNVKKLLKQIENYTKKPERLRYYKKLKKTLFKVENKKIIDIFDKIKTKITKKISDNKSYECNFPIDIVYCWVDGNDPDWQNEKLEWQKKLGVPYSDAVNMCRFLDNEELKYSLRSVAKNAPWINHIYIVTNGQVPKWLDTNNPKISIIKHSDIMPADALPTFNSDAIETCIANIPSLSEHFLYSNDDFYIYSPIEPNYFFDEFGNPIIRLVKPNKKYYNRRLATELYLQNIIYSSLLIKKQFNKEYIYESAHNMESYRKSYYLECKELFKNEYNHTLYSKFRQKCQIQRTIVNFYMLACKGCKLLKVRNKSQNTPLENIYVRLSSPERMNRIITRHSPKLKLFCINDNENTLQENRETLGLYLSKLFPDRQPWELDSSKEKILT